MDKHETISHARSQKPANGLRKPPIAELDRGGIDFTPSPDEVARRAYFSYVSEGSLHGHDVQDWLAVEAESVAEGKLTRIRGFYNSI
jgi:hypothetical protein